MSPQEGTLWLAAAPENGVPQENELPESLRVQLQALGWPERAPDGVPVLAWLMDTVCRGGETDEEGAPRSLAETAVLPLVDELLRVLSEPHRTGPSRQTPLHLAADSPRLTERLLAAGAPVEVRDVHDTPPLHHALSRGNREVVERLLAAGADPHALSGNTDTLGFAARSGRVDLVEHLLALGVDPNRRTGEWGFTPLMRIPFHFDERGLPPPLPVPRHNDTAIVARLLDAGADPSLQAFDGNSALIHALRTGALPETIERLLAGGAPVHRAEAGRWTPLLVAASQHPMLIPRLLAAGASATVVEQRSNGSTLDAPLALTQAWLEVDPWAARSSDDFHASPARFAALMRTLLEHGAPTERVEAYLAGRVPRSAGDREAEAALAHVRAVLHAWHLDPFPVQAAGRPARL